MHTFTQQGPRAAVAGRALPFCAAHVANTRPAASRALPFHAAHLATPSGPQPSPQAAGIIPCGYTLYGKRQVMH